MGWKTLVNLKKDRQGLIIVLGVVFIIGLVAAPNVLPFIAPDGDRGIPVERLEVRTSHDPGTPYSGDIVTVYAYGRSVIVSHDDDISFIIAEDNSASGLYFVGDDQIERRFTLTDDGDGLHFTGQIPAYPVGTRIAYTVSMTVGTESGTSGVTRYTVSTEPEGNGEEPAPIQDQTPPEFDPPIVILDNGVEISWSMFLGTVVWGTVHFEVEFTKGGNKIWSIGLEIEGANGTYGKWYFSLKEGESYIWELDWDTTVMPDGEYVAEVAVSYWTGDTKPAGGHGKIYVLPWASFTLGGTEHGWNVNYDAKLIVVVGTVILIGVAAVYAAFMSKRWKRR